MAGGGAKEAARKAAYAARWLPRMPGDWLAWRRGHLAGGYRRVYQYHVPKTGGTSLTRSFLALGGEDAAAVHARVVEREPHATRSGPYVFVAHDPRALRRGHYLYGWAHHPIWFFTAPPGTFTVAVLRDPLRRLVSWYRYLSDPGADEGMPEGLDRAGLTGAEQGFTVLLDHIHENNLLTQLDMFSKDHDPEEAARRIRSLSAYFFTEDYERGVTEVGRRLGLPLVPRRERQSTGEDWPGADELARARTMLEPEYRLMDLLRKEPGALIGAVPDPPPV